MNKKSLYTIWGGMFIVCAGLGFIPEPKGALAAVLRIAALLFFLPPALLIRHAEKAGDADTLKRVRNLSAISLGATLVLIVLNFFASFSTEFWGNTLYALLILVSSPMVCSGAWAFSLFLWACLLMASLKFLRTK